MGTRTGGRNNREVCIPMRRRTAHRRVVHRTSAALCMQLLNAESIDSLSQADGACMGVNVQAAASTQRHIADASDDVMRPHFECMSVGGVRQIFLKSCHGATVVLNVEPNDTISNLRCHRD